MNNTTFILQATDLQELTDEQLGQANGGQTMMAKAHGAPDQFIMGIGIGAALAGTGAVPAPAA